MTSDGAFEAHGRSTQLFVVLHAYTGSPARMAAVLGEVRRMAPDADILCPQMPTSVFSQAAPEKIARNILGRIDAICAARSEPYRDVVLIGHSVGGLMARMVYLLARERRLAPGGAEDWSADVRRIILFAGMNRGWRIGHHLGLGRALTWTIGITIGHLLSFLTGRETLILQMRRGARFITTLRVRWIELLNRQGDDMPLVIQMLGSVDDLVAPDDNIDLVAGQHFVYLDMAYSGHANAVDLYDPGLVPEPSALHGVEPVARPDPARAGAETALVTRGSLRRKAFEAALLGEEAALVRASVLPADAALPVIERDVTHVVFVIHGIRDRGYWTHKIARRVKWLDRQRRESNAADAPTDAPADTVPGITGPGITGPERMVLRSETSSYGYFPMLSFLLPGARHGKVAWFMDQYAETRARYPEAKVSFVGHSNGTYLLGRALELYDFVNFENVVLAGSVIRTTYPWHRKIGTQVGRVLNFVASGDWVVAIFPRTIETMMWQDLGSGGHDGFEKLEGNLRYVRGEHSAALREENWDDIARFVLGDEVAEIAETLEAEKPNPVVRLAGWLSPLIWLVIAVGLFAIGRGIWLSDWGEAERTLAMLAYLWLIWKVITRF